MKTQDPVNTLNRKQFYREVGNLLYAIAASDNAVRNIERKAMADFIQKQLARMEHTYDSSGMNQAYYAQFNFEEAEKQRVPPATAFSGFERFFDANKALISDELRQAVIAAAVEIASAYRHVNKTEMAMIDSLRDRFGV